MRTPKLHLPPASPQTLALAGLWATLLDFAVAACGLLLLVNALAPPQDLPWKPLRLADPPGMATGMKFARAAGDPGLCRQVLREGGVGFAEAPLRVQGSCRIQNAVRLRGGEITALSPGGPQLTCPVALGYAFWDRHAVQPAARDLLGSAVVKVDHYGSYACRNIYGRASGRPSEHAFANALDVAGFRTADGRRITVARDFRGATPESRFLRAARDGACGWFRGVLSPDYNAAHRDHFHLDAGPYGICH